MIDRFEVIFFMIANDLPWVHYYYSLYIHAMQYMAIDI